MTRRLFSFPLLTISACLLGACASSGLSDRAQAAFDRQDRNGDGLITEADIVDASDARFERADSDRTNTLSHAEFIAVRDERGQGGRPMGRGVGQFEELDRDADGSLSRAEFADPALRLFDRADRNRDGRITEAEFAENLDARRERRTQRRPPAPRR